MSKAHPCARARAFSLSLPLPLPLSLSLSWYLSLSLSFRRSGHISCGHRAIDTEEGETQDSWQGAGQKVELRLGGEEGQKVEGKEIN